MYYGTPEPCLACAVGLSKQQTECTADLPTCHGRSLSLCLPAYVLLPKLTYSPNGPSLGLNVGEGSPPHPMLFYAILRNYHRRMPQSWTLLREGSMTQGWGKKKNPYFLMAHALGFGF